MPPRQVRSALRPACQRNDTFAEHRSISQRCTTITAQMNPKVLQLNPRDNVLVALQNLVQGDAVTLSGQSYSLASNVPAKHKFAIRDLSVGDSILMYGVVVGK